MKEWFPSKCRDRLASKGGVDGSLSHVEYLVDDLVC